MLGISGKRGDWGELPSTLGMTVDDDGVLSGTWNAVRLVGLHERVEEEASVSNDDGTYDRELRDFTWIRALLEPPLRMGLVVGGSAAQPTGHAELDASFRASGHDADHVRRVLTVPAVADALLHARRHGSPLRVDDTRVWIERPGWERRTNVLAHDLEWAGRVAEALLEARRVDRAAWEPAFEDAWGRVAAGWGVDFDPRDARIVGAVRGTRIEASIGPDGTGTQVRVALAHALGCELRLERQRGGFFGRLFRGQDIVVGDREFDEAFVVKGEPVARVRAALHPSARRRLLEVLRGAGGMTLSRDTISVDLEERLDDPAALDRLLKSTFAAAEALAPGQAPPAGPFRG